MASILLKSVPETLHRRLKEEAERNRRSMVQQALVILDEGLRRGLPLELPTPVKPKGKATAAMVRKGIRQGRA